MLNNYFHDELDFCKLTSGYLEYPAVSATFKAGKGINTEGELIITGTEGYVYVPSPWWKTEYFEVRHEDLRDTKKYFYQCSGEGLRYEISEFLKGINDIYSQNSWSANDSLGVAKIMELFGKSKNKIVY